MQIHDHCSLVCDLLLLNFQTEKQKLHIFVFKKINRRDETKHMLLRSYAFYVIMSYEHRIKILRLH